MSIPLDRLYHFIENTVYEIYGNAVIIYRFWPHGSKNIQDLNPMPTYNHNWAGGQINPAVWCHDQEPLCYEFYTQQSREFDSGWTNLLKSHGLFRPSENLNYARNIFQKNILLHSEKRSRNVEKYLSDNQLLPVYYWSHAIIARDWFRYAEHENFSKKIKKLFLIYNRVWTGTREYRLKFSDLLIKHDLVNQCMTFFNPVADQQHYKDHVFENQEWRPDHTLENYFSPSLTESSASADFDTQDYRSTAIEVVLETLFDDDRLHLTEKILRPIACGQPFILMATHGSLQYLRDYGFKTFDAVWDESYDLIQDPYERMLAVIQTMKTVAAWTDKQRSKKYQQLQAIAEHNKRHFFSVEFSNSIIMELKINLSVGLEKILSDPRFDIWIARWREWLRYTETKEFLLINKNMASLPQNLCWNPTQKQYEQVLEFISSYSLKKKNN